MPPSLSGCSAASIRGADMPALRSAGITSTQFLAVWSLNGAAGFTPAQLKAAGVTIAEMQTARLTILQMYNGGVSIADLLSAGLSIAQLRTGSVPDHALFNEACNTSSTFCIMEEARIECTANHPTITLTTTNLSVTDDEVVLEGEAVGGLAWRSSGMTVAIFSIDPLGNRGMLGSATVELTEKNGGVLVSTLSIPLADVFSNPTVSVTGGQAGITTSIQLCPGS